MVTTGAKIKKLREVRGYSQSYMAAKLHISQEQNSYLENKQRNISDKNIQEICALLNVSDTYLENFDPRHLIQNEPSPNEKLAMQDFMGESDKPDREAYLELINRLMKELAELKKEIAELKTASNK